MRNASRWKAWPTVEAALLVLLGVAGSGGVSWWLELERRQAARADFDEKASEQLHALSSAFAVMVDELSTVATVVQVLPSLDRATFHEVAAPIVSRHPYFQALEWAPLVPHAARAAVEQGVRDEGFVDFRLLERGADGLVAAAARQEYYPVLYAEPFAGNGRALGFDLASEPTRRAAIDRVLREGRLAASGRIQLVQDSTHQAGVLLFVPVYALVPTGGGERTLRGLVVGVVKLADLVGREPFSGPGLDLEVVDLAGEPGERVLFERPGSLRGDPRALRHAHRVPLGDRTWELVLRAVPRRTDRGYVWLTVALGGGVGGLLAALRSRTRRRAEEQARAAEELARKQVQLEAAVAEAQQATRLKGEFVANMSHEIRTPLNAVIGLAYLALRMPMDPAMRRYLLDIHESGRHLLALVNDVLDFSKLEAGKLTLDEAELTVEGLLQRLATMVAPRAQAKGLEVLFDVAPDVPPTLRGDPLRLSQVLLNYANNAVKFTERGSLTVRVAVVERDVQAVTLRFSVEDTGIGLTEDQRGRLFRSFEQGDASITRSYGGTGLGLAISRHLAEQMGGGVGVLSELGKGSTFWFTARLRLAPGGAGRPSPRSGIVGGRVLVVDDNEGARSVLSAMLVELKFKPDTAESGEEALRLIQSTHGSGQRYDAILLDWRMPGLDGIATAARIRQLLPGNACPRLLMVTAHGRDEASAAAENAGISQVLLKPVTGSALHDALAVALSGAVVAASQGQAASLGLPPDITLPLGTRVLVVDDAPLNQEIARELLESAGCVVYTADNGQQALASVARERFDLVLMDLQMPLMDGLTATAAIRANPAHAALPILAMTANVLAEDRERCLRAGMQGVLTKPVEPADLFRAVAHAVSLEPPPVVPASVPPASSPGGTLLLDTAAGLRNVAQRRELYELVLGKFVVEHRDEVKAIRGHLDAGDVATASRGTHTLKGLAATLAAPRLQVAATALDAALLAGRPPVDVAPLLDEADRVLAETVAAMERELGTR